MDKSPPLNCKLVVHLLLGGGVERVVLQLAASMNALGHDAEIILLEDIIGAGVDVPARVRITALGGKMRGGFFGRQVLGKWRRARMLKKHARGADLVFASTPYAHEVCHMAKLPNLWHRVDIAVGAVHTAPLAARSKRKEKRDARKQRRIYKNASMVAVSNGVADDLANLGIAPKTVRVIENPFDFAEIRRRAEEFSPQETDYIIHVGRFDPPQKRHDVLLRAYAKARVPQKLLLLGDAENSHGEKMRGLAAELGIADRVVFKGFCRNPYPFIKNARALVLSSDYEGFGLVLAEALILGTPAVSTDCPAGPAEILTGELAAFLSPRGDADALAENIKKVIKNPPDIVAHHFERFDATICARKYLELRES